MRFKFIALLVCFGMQAFVAHAEYRKFADANGRIIEAELVRYDSSQKKVTIKRKGNGATKTVPISIFSETDQKYIISWNENQDFLSERKLKVIFNRRKNKNTDKSSSGGWWDRKYYDCSFSIEFDNRSTVDFTDVDFSYVIFYTQEHHTKNRTDKNEEHGSLYAKKTISLPSKSTKEIETEKLILCHYKVAESSSGQPDIEGEMHGIILNLSMKSETGGTISRQIKYPDDLRHVWTPKTKNVLIQP